MTENKGNSKPEPGNDQGDRIIEGAEGRKGIIVVPVDSSPIDIQDLAPGGSPTPQAPTSTPAPDQNASSSSSEE
jgi:hypothetical protein